jgi:hypothetical protein
MTFTASAGDKIMFQASGSTYAPAPYIGVTRGTTRIASWYGNRLTNVLKMPANGTYTITVDPRTRTEGAIVVRAWEVPADEDAGTLAVDGITKTVATSDVGQNGFIEFTGEAHERIRITTAHSNYTKKVRVELRRANGKVLFARSGEFTSKAITLPANGTYKLFFNPQDLDTGSIKVKVFTP